MMRALRHNLKAQSFRKFSSSVNIRILKEKAGEQRVAMVPAVAQKLIKDGYSVAVEANAGVVSGFGDAAFKEVGCTIASDRDALIRESQMIFSIDPPPAQDLEKMSG